MCKWKTPAYQCHKIVRALKLRGVFELKEGGLLLVLWELEISAPFSPTDVSWSQRYKGSTEDFGYFVVYDGGHTSWSPTVAFEDDYSRIYT
jgi:hypothetical protein